MMDYVSAEDRLQHWQLHPSHKWIMPGDADCWHDNHADIECEYCETPPFVGYTCYHELPLTHEADEDDISFFMPRAEALKECPGNE